MQRTAVETGDRLLQSQHLFQHPPARLQSTRRGVRTAQNIQGGLQRRSIITITITIIMMNRQMCWRRLKRTW